MVDDIPQPNWKDLAVEYKLELEKVEGDLKALLDGDKTAQPLPEVVQLALDAVQGPRNQSYGAASRNFSDIAGLLAASGFIRRNGEFITPAQTALIQLCVKLSRLMHTPDHKDSVVDIIGYMLCYWQCVEAQKDAQKEG